MMKAKNVKTDDETPNGAPRHCYFWIATLNNGSVIPEYDFDNQCHNKVKDLPVEFVTMFSWYPVNLTMVSRVKNIFNELLRLAVDTKIHTLNIDIEKGECLNVYPVWQNDINIRMGHMVYYALFKQDKTGRNLEGYFINEYGKHVCYWVDKNLRPNHKCVSIPVDIIFDDDGNQVLDFTFLRLLNLKQEQNSEGNKNI